LVGQFFTRPPTVDRKRTIRDRARLPHEGAGTGRG
jgi:hypothetical protein